LALVGDSFLGIEAMHGRLVLMITGEIVRFQMNLLLFWGNVGRLLVLHGLAI